MNCEKSSIKSDGCTNFFYLHDCGIYGSILSLVIESIERKFDNGIEEDRFDARITVKIKSNMKYD